MDYRARWQNGVLRLLTNTAPDLDEGETVHVTVERGRSGNSHRHQFAWLADAWENLPEKYAFEDWARSKETLRKYALIQTGYFHQSVIDCGESAIAKAVSTEIKKAKDEAHGYAQAIWRDGIAIVRWAESQSKQAMGGERFQKSKSDIMDFIADLIGVPPGEIRRLAA